MHGVAAAVGTWLDVGDQGGTSAGEVALAICAEVLAVRNGRPPLSLQATSGPIQR
jgi:xanthine/CO dehydrogenase XdhC/CoxF family maturation factor